MRTTTAYVGHLQLVIKTHSDASWLGLVVRLGSRLKVAAGIGSGKALDGAQFCALGLDGEHQAGTNQRSIHQDGACPTHPVLAAEVGAGEAEVVAEHVGQASAGFDGH